MMNTRRGCFDFIKDGVSAYTAKHMKLRRRDFDFQYAVSLRERLLAGGHIFEELSSPLSALRDLNIDSPASEISPGYVQMISETLDDAAQYASLRCYDAKPTASGKKFALVERIKNAGNEDAADGEIMIECPPDLSANEQTLASIWMLQRLRQIVEDLKRGRSSNSDQQPIKGVELADALRALINSLDQAKAALTPQAVVDVVPQMLGPHGDPLVNVLCASNAFRDSVDL